jgi:hypothetical protein
VDRIAAVPGGMRPLPFIGGSVPVDGDDALLARYARAAATRAGFDEFLKDWLA